MMTAMEIVALFRLDDQATATLRRIAAEARALTDQFKILTDQAKAFSTAMGSTFRTMGADVGTATAEVRTLAAEWAKVEAAALAAGRAAAFGGPLGGGFRGTPRTTPGIGGGPPSGIHMSPFTFPGGSARMGSNLAMGAAALMGYGIYEEAEVEDIAARALMTGQIRVDAGMTQTQAFQKLRDVIKKNSELGAFDPKQVGEALLGSERQFAGLTFDKRMEALSVMLPAAMQEARFKETGLKESAEALVGLAHMTGTYDPAKLPDLYRKFTFASMLTPAPLPEFTRALAAGIRSSKAGTWIQSFFGKLMPEAGDSKKAQTHNERLRALGLLNDQSNPTWMAKNAQGKTDWDASLLKLAPMLGARLADLPETQRLSIIQDVFGKQGGREAGLTNLPEFIAQFPRLEQMMAMAPRGEDFLTQLGTASPVQKARQSLTDLKVILMDIGEKALPPVVGGLQSIDVFLKGIGSIVGTTFPKPTPLSSALLKGMGEGAAPGAAIGFGIGSILGPGAIPSAGIGAAVGAFGGGLYEGGRHLLGLDVPLRNIDKDAAGAAKNLNWLDSVLKSMGLLHKSSFNGSPVPKDNGAASIYVPIKLDIDGRTFAQTIGMRMASLYEFPGSAPYHDGVRSLASNDMQTTST